MYRLLLWMLLIGGWMTAGSSYAQHSATGFDPSAASVLEYAAGLPPTALPVQQPLSALSVPPDTLSEAAILQHIARLYSVQAEVLTALVDGQDEKVQTLLDQAMADLGLLVRIPSLTEQPRFAELYRSIVTEYEAYYGVSDTLMLPHGNIFPFRQAMFASLNALDEPLLEDVVQPGLRPMPTAVPMTSNRLVKQSVSYLLRDPEKHLHHWLSRAQTYFPMIETILAEESVPDELKYLALIESGLNPRARSWARAVGMWQFMSATGRMYGLQVNAWVDERMDPEKATRAAAQHLRDLYAEFGDWHLALAAYNAGAGNVRRALRRTSGRTFWDAYPYLPRETRNYVPMFIAASLVASNPGAFDVDAPAPGPRYEYDLVPVRGVLLLSEVAELAGTNEVTLRALNPELRRSMTPPSEGPYFIRIPHGTAARFMDGYRRLPDEKKRSVVEYVVRRGDVLGKIARRYDVSVAALKRHNGLHSNLIRVGQRLIVPVPHYQASTSVAKAEPVSIRYGTRTVRPVVAARPVMLSPREEEGPPVRKASLAGAATEQAAAKPAETTAKKEPAKKTQAPSDERVTYTVRRGDTLGKIAQRHGTSVSKLKQWNGLRSTRIYAGQRLTIYGASTAKQAPTTYRVRRGDSLYTIARRHGVTVSQLKRWNGLTSNTIKPGQRLTINS